MKKTILFVIISILFLAASSNADMFVRDAFIRNFFSNKTTTSGSYLLLESGDYFLLESGSKLILE